MGKSLLKVKKTIKPNVKKFKRKVFSSSMIRLSGFHICDVYEKKLVLGTTKN